MRGIFDTTPTIRPSPGTSWVEEVSRMDITFIKIVGLAILGGLARMADAVLKGEKLDPVRLLARVVVSGYSGYLAAEALKVYSPDWQFVAAGVGGFAGAEFVGFMIRLLSKYAGKRLGVKTTEEELDALSISPTKRKDNKTD